MNEQMEKEMENCKENGVIKIGSSITNSHYVLPNVIKSLQDHYPELKIITYVNNTKVLEKQILENKLDIAIIESQPESNNVIKITVTARNGFTKKDYNINVYKRNSEEEAKYQEEQKNSQEKLNQIYEVKKNSNEQEQNKENQEKIENNEQEGKEERNRLVAFFTLIAMVLILTSISILSEKRKK